MKSPLARRCLQIGAAGLVLNEIRGLILAVTFGPTVIRAALSAWGLR